MGGQCGAARRGAWQARAQIPLDARAIRYEQESRSLKLERDTAVHAKRQLADERKDADERYEGVLTTLRELQITSENRASELNTELKMKEFERERSRILHDEAQASLSAAVLEGQKLRAKVELLTAEFHELQNVSDTKIAALGAKLSEHTTNLSAYESLEKELDDVVMHAADADEPNQVLMAYGCGLDRMRG